MPGTALDNACQITAVLGHVTTTLLELSYNATERAMRMELLHIFVRKTKIETLIMFDIFQPVFGHIQMEIVVKILTLFMTQASTTQY